MKTKHGTILDPILLKIWGEGFEIEGEIIYLDKFYIEVQITKPYVNWEKTLCITGPGTMNPNHFLWRSEEVGKRLLMEIFHTLRRLDISIERYAELYKRYLEEKASLEVIEDEHVKRRIVYKIDDRLFSDFPYVGIMQRDKFKTILDSFLRDGRKIYLNQWGMRIVKNN